MANTWFFHTHRVNPKSFDSGTQKASARTTRRSRSVSVVKAIFRHDNILIEHFYDIWLAPVKRTASFEAWNFIETRPELNHRTAFQLSFLCLQLLRSYIVSIAVSFSLEIKADFQIADLHLTMKFKLSGRSQNSVKLHDSFEAVTQAHGSCGLSSPLESPYKQPNLT